MNSSNFQHAAYALAMMVATWGVTGDWLAGACFSVAFFLGREHAQYQNKIGDNNADLEALKFWKWSTDSQLDLLFPIVTAGIMLVVVNLFNA